MKKALLIVVILVFALFMGCTQQTGGFVAIDSDKLDSNSSAVYNNLSDYKKAKDGDTVKVDYTGRFTDNTIFDSSKKAGRTPLEFTIGDGGMIKGFNDAVIGMKVGETKTVTLAPEQAYGVSDPKNIISIDANKFAQFNSLQVGMEVSGGSYAGIVIEKNDTNALIDFNHPMAGKTLIFEITLIEIQ